MTSSIVNASSYSNSKAITMHNSNSIAITNCNSNSNVITISNSNDSTIITMIITSSIYGVTINTGVNSISINYTNININNSISIYGVTINTGVILMIVVLGSIILGFY